MDRPRRPAGTGYVDALRLAAMRNEPAAESVLGRVVAGAHAPASVARRDNHSGAGPDPRDGDQLRQPGGVRTRREKQARQGPGTTGTAGSHRLRATREPPARGLAVAAVHWLEREDLLEFTSRQHDEPYVQYGAKAIEPPPGDFRSGAFSSTSRLP